MGFIRLGGVEVVSDNLVDVNLGLVARSDPASQVHHCTKKDAISKLNAAV